MFIFSIFSILNNTGTDKSGEECTVKNLLIFYFTEYSLGQVEFQWFLTFAALNQWLFIENINFPPYFFFQCGNKCTVWGCMSHIIPAHKNIAFVPAIKKY